MRRKTGTFRQTCYLLAGVLMGYLTGNVARIATDRCRGQILPVKHVGVLASILNLFSRKGVEHNKTTFYTDKNLVLVAVMTTREFLRTRGVSVHDTWAKSIPGEVIFFTSEGSENLTRPGMKVVGLQGVDDAYPPQKKAFMMLKYIHDHYLHQFRFFMRADDDAYIKGAELLKYLHSVRPTGIPVIGSPGLGNKEELGKLYLRDDDNYCMGGPGVVMTREILAKTVPHIEDCLNNLYTTHEDVEIGRCIMRYADVGCTWSNLPKLFYHNFMEPNGSFTHSLWHTGIQKALTLHPVKQSSYMYRLHQHLLTVKASNQQRRLRGLQREIDAMDHLLKHRDTMNSHDLFREITAPLNRSTQRADDEVFEWDSVRREQLYSTRSAIPKRKLPFYVRSVMSDIREKTWKMMHHTALNEGRKLRHRNVKFLYTRLDQMRGQSYILELLTWPLRLIPQKRTAKDARYQTAFAHRSFLDVEFREDFRVNNGYQAQLQKRIPLSIPVVKTSLDGDPQTELRQRSSEGRNQLEIYTDNKFESFSISQSRVNFILSLVGRYSTFLKFIQNFEEVCLKRHENVSLTIMLFRNDPNDTSADVINYVTRLKQMYNDSTINVVLINGSFSRGVALQNASRRFQEGDLLFFIDVDLEVGLQSSTLLRIRINTVKGQTVYAPILFSHYDPQYLPPNISNQFPKDVGDKFNLDRGYWRQYGFGILSTYKCDLDRAGGFKEDIKGWGLEDVDLLQKFISANLSIFRSVDVGLFHRFHPIICDSVLDKKQYTMCLGTKLTTIASIKRMAEIVYHTPEIYNRRETYRTTDS